MEFITLLVKLPAMFLCIGFVVRFLGQLGRADFYNPLGQTVLSLTNWLIIPLRKIIPSYGKMDISCIVAVYLTQLAFAAIILSLAGYTSTLLTLQFYLVGIISIATAFISVLYVSMIIIGIASFLLAGQYNPFISFISQFVDPFIRPFRKLNFQIGVIDLSFLIAIFALLGIKMLILIPLAQSLGFGSGLFFGL